MFIEIGFLRSKKEKKPANKAGKKDKDVVNGNGKNGGSSGTGSPKETLRQTSISLMMGGDASSNEANRESNLVSDVKVDDEGYIIPPHAMETESSGVRTSSKRKELDNFYSDSDTSDDEDTKKPIHVVIKPISENQNMRTTGSIAELKETVKGLSISPSLLPSVRLYSHPGYVFLCIVCLAVFLMINPISSSSFLSDSLVPLLAISTLRKRNCDTCLEVTK